MSRAEQGVSSAAGLQARADRQPQAVALRSKRRGRWHELTWADAARQARQAAQGWAALGLLRGGSIGAVGALGPAFVASLFGAVESGLRMQVGAAATAGVRHVLVDCGHDLERVLRDAGPALGCVAIADADALAGVQAPAGVRLISFDALLALGAQSPPPALGLPFPAPAVLRRVDAGGGFAEIHAPAILASADDGTVTPRVLLDFDSDWLPGLAWLLDHWSRSGATLVLPEPGGDSGIDRREAAASLWLAPSDRLLAFTAELQRRTAARGLAAAAVRAALSEARHPAANLARWRIRDELGLRRMAAVVTDLDAGAAPLAVLRTLGIAAPTSRKATKAASDTSAELLMAGSAT